ncbi:MAG: GntR family transcriptional regulator [Alphaproteobacteria bacterium]|nr:MAG: GntR family transcriptional regulator [Alphaproteobacteria bacterium]
MTKSASDTSAVRTLQEAVHEGSPTPLYYQIYVILRDKITSRVYPDGSLLPSEHELEKIFGVSRITAKRALDELASEGLVTRQRGRGTRVTFKGPYSSLAGDMHGLLEDLLTIIKETDVEVLEFDYVPASPSTADALKIKTGDMVQKAVRVRRRKGTPLAYVTTYVPEDIGRSYTLEELKDNPLVALIERDGHKISSARQTITATLADSTLAEALEIRVGSPLLKVIRVVLDENDKPVELITVHYRPDLYQIHLNLTRARANTKNFWSTT